MFFAALILAGALYIYNNGIPGLGEKEQSTGITKYRDANEFSTVENVYSSWNREKNIANRQRSDRLINFDDEEIAL